MASTASWTEVDDPRTITGTCGWPCAARAVMLDNASGPSFCETNAAARFARSRAASAPDSVETEVVAKPTDSSAAMTGLASTPLGTASTQVRPEPQLLVPGISLRVSRNATARNAPPVPARPKLATFGHWKRSGHCRWLTLQSHVSELASAV